MTSIYVRGFPRRTGERELEKMFETYGTVNDVRMVRDFAFVVPPSAHRPSRIGRPEKRLLAK
jgi:RNA recognition motif-containing protein